MSGKPKEVVNYFPHMCNASDGRTLYILEHKYGISGYGFWFKLLEILGSTAGHYFDFTGSVLSSSSCFEAQSGHHTLRTEQPACSISDSSSATSASSGAGLPHPKQSVMSPLPPAPHTRSQQSDRRTCPSGPSPHR